MADERSQPPWNQPSPIARGFDWPSLLARDGDALFDHYRHTLDKLGAERGTIGLDEAQRHDRPLMLRLPKLAQTLAIQFQRLMHSKRPELALLAQWARILARNLATAWLCSWHTRDSVTLSTAAISFRFMSCS